MRKNLLIGVALVCAFLCGRFVGLRSEQHANDLLRAGFVIVDPAGFEVEGFDSGFEL